MQINFPTVRWPFQMTQVNLESNKILLVALAAILLVAAFFWKRFFHFTPAVNGGRVSPPATTPRSQLNLTTTNNSDPAPVVTDPLKRKIIEISNLTVNQGGDKVVFFYKNGPSSFLGNFENAPNGVTVFGERFNCAEAAFQWRKYNLSGVTDPRMSEFFTINDGNAFALNKYLRNKYLGVLVAGWDNGLRDQAMWEVLQAKFAQNPYLRDLLLSTGDAYLQEHNQVVGRDVYWSDDHNGKIGKNMLGKMLMAIRKGLQEGKPPVCPPVDDSSDQEWIESYAHFANAGLSYTIF